ncbi:DUF72 domain-containing protein [Legionella cardiaca]|uniref:DUF72 domain-containing protein n=1 Tax=Legionella cardiaca TaxID=1071983 RepID=A0ABY8AS90_9GAMM|nr:DUF72 domain-containing protein [Legionella cardiaca]WED43547.1 DUF72 domain-containing protein [Legionella cardiaca]
MPKNQICIGTSGWVYSGWIGNFYPEKIKQTQTLPYYAEIFNSVELNNSFYQIPKEKNIKKWLELTPKNFIFSCKANRYITHMKKLQDTTDSVARLLDAFSHFEEKLGPILFQFPPYWPIDLPCLQKFIENLPHQYAYTFEFRHKSWFCESLYELLDTHQMALCFYDFKTYQSPQIVTSPFIYIRMHGPNLKPYQGAYEDQTLLEYAKKISDWQNNGKAIYCYFDNDEKCCAPQDAQRLKKIVM